MEEAKEHKTLPFMRSYSQNFEDVMLRRALQDIRCGFYIDVGAFDPLMDSVTNWFYGEGWSGINIEPNPEMLATLQVARTRDVNLGCAIGQGVRQHRVLGGGRNRPFLVREANLACRPGRLGDACDQRPGADTGCGDHPPCCWSNDRLPQDRCRRGRGTNLSRRQARLQSALASLSWKRSSRSRCFPTGQRGSPPCSPRDMASFTLRRSEQVLPAGGRPRADHAFLSPPLAALIRSRLPTSRRKLAKPTSLGAWWRCLRRCRLITRRYRQLKKR